MMEEQFQLHEFGGLSLSDQNTMTAEDRAWWLKRAERHLKEQEQAANDAARKNGSRRRGR